MLTILRAASLIVSILLCSGSPARCEDVSVILKHMDAAAPTLRTMSADIRMLTVTAVIDDKVIDVGVLKMQKGKNDSVRAVFDFSDQKDASKEIGFFGKTVRLYYPKANYYQDYDFGKSINLVNQFLLLGFGTSGEELAKSYTISPEGEEKLSGVATTKLLLTPKDPKVKERLSKIEIWIPEGQSNPVQQEFFEPNENYRIVTYTNIKLNQSMKGTLDIKMHSNTQKRGT